MTEDHRTARDGTGSGSLRVAVAQPRTTPSDVAANVEAHVSAIAAADAQVVVFPELSLTGYELAAPALDPEDPRIEPLVAACRRHGTVALVGAPILDRQHRYIATLVVSGDGARAVYRKMCLGGSEHDAFRSGTAAASTVVAGWRLGIGICKDARIRAHLDATFALGVDCYTAGLVHDASPDETAEIERRARHVTETRRVPVAFASAAGPAGTSYPVAAGRSGIWAGDGSAVARCGSEPDAVAVTTLVRRSDETSPDETAPKKQP